MHAVASAAGMRSMMREYRGARGTQQPGTAVRRRRA
jgi:hypothetical protein